MKRTTFIAVVATIMVVTLVRVAATHRVFSPTFDEHVHVAAGYQWLTGARFAIDAHELPLVRIFLALPFRNVPQPPFGDSLNVGNALFNDHGRYVHNIAQARTGNLVFLLLAMVALVLWTERLFDSTHAVVALLLFTSAPPVLGNAGLATTDMGAAATITLALYALTIWLDEPTWPRTFFLGAAMGLGLSAKFFFIPFFGLAAVVLLIARRRMPSPRGLVSLLIAFFIVWGVHKFDVGTMEREWAGMPRVMAERYGWPAIATTPLPFPRYFVSIVSLKQLDEKGRTAYLFGRISQNGWWYYFPIALGVKMPMPFLFLFVAGVWILLWRHQRIEIVVMVAVLLAFMMTRHINIGVRHLLSLIPIMAIVGSAGAVALWARERVVVSLLLLWLIIGTALAHPDYLAWFNEAAGSHPERILVDSNLDWGQDLFRLARECRQEHVDRLGINLLTSANLNDVGLPQTYELEWYKPASGWLAISETQLQIARATEPLAFAWLTEGRAYRRVGKSIRLYYVR